MKGKRIVVTRAPHQADELNHLLEQRGAIPLLFPCIDIAPPDDTRQLDAMLLKIADFDWLIFTSVNTVRVLAQRLTALNQTTFNNLRVATIGTATAQAANDHLNLKTHLIPDEFVAESLIEALEVVKGKNILLPQSDKARPVLAKHLQEAGANVTTIVAYQNIIGQGGIHLMNYLETRQVDAITFTSSSTVENFLKRLNGATQYLDGVCIACIGPITAKTAQELGLNVAVTPKEHTLEGLVNELEHYFA